MASAWDTTSIGLGGSFGSSTDLLTGALTIDDLRELGRADTAVLSVTAADDLWVTAVDCVPWCDSVVSPVISDMVRPQWDAAGPTNLVRY